jgi:VanZ family protein
MMNGLHSQKKAAQYLLLTYCLFIVYGCFIPFLFNLDPNFIRWRWEVFLLEPIEGRIPRPSLPDVASNIRLFVPLGILCVWLRMTKGTSERALPQILLTAIYGLLFGLAIESGQTLSPWRNPSLLDAVCNAAGAFIGAISGRALFRGFERSVETGLFHVLSLQPSLLVLGYLLLGVVMDSFYPFAVTLDISAIWQNVKRSQFVPFTGGLHRYWLDLFIQKGAVFAVVGYLVNVNIRYRRGGVGAPLTWLLCSALAFSIETAKLFFGGRAFYSENVIISSAGALAGIVLYPRFSASAWLNSRRQNAYIILIIVFLVYFEISPFEWIPMNEIPARFYRIEWLPFKAYYSAEPLTALFDLQTKIYFLMPLGFVVMSLSSIQRAALPPRRALLVCIFIAVSLESLQVLVRSRIPSITDIIIFSTSAWLGIKLFEAFQRIKMQALRQTNAETVASRFSSTT